MKRIINGGIELALFQIVGDDCLTEKDKERKAYLESLPKGVWITLDANGMAITNEDAEKMAIAELEKYSIKP